MKPRKRFLGWFFAVIALAGLCGLPVADAEVVRPAPNFQWQDASGRDRSATQFRGQPLLLLIAPSPRDWRFRSQLRELRRVRERLGATGAVVIAAFTELPGRIPSDIPIALAANGPAVGIAYESPDRFAIAFIGLDGNLDFVTNSVQSGQRVLDVIGNSAAIQERLRLD